MIFPYALEHGHLTRLPHDASLQRAAWVDLYRPTPAQVAAVAALGVTVPSLAEMQEIELSNRVYRDGLHDYMTAMLPGQTPDGTRIMGPVTLILSPDQLITIRHHDPRPFTVFPDRAQTKAAGCKSTDRLLLGLIEEMVARLADMLEAADRALEETGRTMFSGQTPGQDQMQTTLGRLATEGETLSRVRLALMTLERVLTYFNVRVARKREDATLVELVKGQLRDIAAMTEHVDFIAARMGQLSDATLAMINLAQTATARILSVVAVLFLPPTLVASVYGMNFANLPGIDDPRGYLLATGLMVASALGTLLFFRWKGWL